MSAPLLRCVSVVRIPSSSLGGNRRAGCQEGSLGPVGAKSVLDIPFHRTSNRWKERPNEYFRRRSIWDSHDA